MVRDRHRPKVFLAATLVFFITFFNTLSGIRGVDKALCEVVRVQGGSEWQIFTKVMLPHASAWILTGLKMSLPFAHTELDFLLRNLGVRTMVVTGTFTNVCVDSTARDAYVNAYYVVVPDDLTANPDLESQHAALKTLGHFFGVVVPSSDLLAVWQGQRR